MAERSLNGEGVVLSPNTRVVGLTCGQEERPDFSGKLTFPIIQAVVILKTA